MQLRGMTMSMTILVVATIWPLVIVPLGLMPFLRVGRVREAWWSIGFVAYASLLATLAIMYGCTLDMADARGAVPVSLPDSAYTRAELATRWFALGAIVSTFVAARSHIKFSWRPYPWLFR